MQQEPPAMDTALRRTPPVLHVGDRYASVSSAGSDSASDCEEEAGSPAAAESPGRDCEYSTAAVQSAQMQLGTLYTAAQAFESVFAQAWPGSFATHDVVRELGRGAQVTLTEAHTLLAVLEVLEVRTSCVQDTSVGAMASLQNLRFHCIL